MQTYSCLCSNVTVDVTRGPVTPVHSLWTAPIEGTGTVSIKYHELTTTTIVDKWSLIRCGCCKRDCCMILGTEVVVNPLFEQTDELRKSMTHFATYDLYVDTKEHPVLPAAPAAYAPSTLTINRDPVEKVLIPIKQRRIEELFQEKERRIRAFVLEQEELYETERRQVLFEYETLRSTMEVFYRNEVPKLTTTPNKTTVRPKDEIFDMDEDYDSCAAPRLTSSDVD